jgi:UDP-glucose:glycoprotein glucosyltransferase
LEHHERQARINLLGVRLQELQLTSGSAWPTLTPLEQSNLIEVAAASAVKPPSDDARQITIPPEAEYGIRVSKEKAALRVTAVIDPLSRAAQKLSSLLVLLRSTMEVEIKVILVPQVNPTDLTLKNFFRFVVPEMRFTTDGKYAKFPNPPLIRGPLLRCVLVLTFGTHCVLMQQD